MRTFALKILTLAMASCILLFCGCSEKARYPVMSFFFDGVPLPEEAKEELQAESKVEEKVEMPKRKTCFEHGPYAAKQCEGCHMAGSNMLIVPKDKLCLHCHKLDLRKQYIHGPLSSGGCTVCHQPHLSPYTYLLVSEPREFCLYCHDAEDVLKNPAHKTVEVQCTACHDAHGAEKAHLLK